MACGAPRRKEKKIRVEVTAPSPSIQTMSIGETQIIVDYLFLSQSVNRIQAITDVRNKASQNVLSRAGFRIEGTIRKSAFVGEKSNAYLYSILREEWKEPKILTKTA